MALEYVGLYDKEYYTKNEFYKAFNQRLTPHRVHFGASKLRVESLKMGIVHTVGLVPSWAFLFFNLGEKFFSLGKALYSDPMQNVDDDLSRAADIWRNRVWRALKDCVDGVLAIVVFPFFRVVLIIKDFASALITPEIGWKKKSHDILNPKGIFV